MAADLTKLVCSLDAVIRERAYAELLKVGPHGYIHGWIKVGPGVVGERVHHPEHGPGTVVRVTPKRSMVDFVSGAQHSFEHGGTGSGHFTPRRTVRIGPDLPLAGRGDLSTEQLARGEHLTPAGRKALDALGPAGHPRVVAIPDTEGKIREAYRMLAIPGAGSDHYVALADLRKLIGEQVPRAEVDATLRRLHNAPDVRLTPQHYARGNAATRQPAALLFGGQQLDQIHIDDPSLARPSEFSAVAMAEELRARRSGGGKDPMMARLSSTALRAEVKQRAARDPMVRGDLERLRLLPATRLTAEDKARARQADIDQARSVANAAANIHERLLSGETSPEVLRRSIQGHTNRGLPQTTADQWAAVAHDSNLLRAAVDAHAKRAKLTRTSQLARPAAYDRALHEPIGEPLRPGQKVSIVRPGYTYRRKGEDIRLSKAVVEPYEPQSMTDVANRVRASTSREAAAPHLAGLTKPQLKAVAERLNMALPSRETKAQHVARILGRFAPRPSLAGRGTWDAAQQGWALTGQARRFPPGSEAERIVLEQSARLRDGRASIAEAASALRAGATLSTTRQHRASLMSVAHQLDTVGGTSVHPYPTVS